MSAGAIKFEWTEERVEIALKMTAEKHPASYIAKTLGTTANAVIGKVHRERARLGLHVPRPRGPLGRERSPAEVRSPTVAPVPRASADDVESVPVVWPMIEKGTGEPCGMDKLCGCKWPLREDPTVYGKHLFCNAPRPVNQPYCQEHSRRAGEKYRVWTAADDRRIKQDWRGGRGRDLLAQVLRRPKASVTARARQLGLLVPHG